MWPSKRIASAEILECEDAPQEPASKRVCVPCHEPELRASLQPVAGDRHLQQSDSRHGTAGGLESRHGGRGSDAALCPFLYDSGPSGHRGQSLSCSHRPTWGGCNETADLDPGRRLLADRRGLQRGLVTESGLVIRPDFALADSPALDTLVVPGGAGLRDRATSARIVDWLRASAPRARRVAS